MRKLALILTITLVFCAGAAFSAEKEELIPVKALVHLNTNISSGEYSPEKLVLMARDAGVDAVFMTENYLPRWEYGLFPFRNVIKKIVVKNGLLQYGVERYIERIDAINKSVPEVTVIMAAEVAPFYYWTGSSFKKDTFTLNDWDLQFLVTGMKPSDYENIPTLSAGSFSRYSWKSVFLLWPFILMIFGFISLKKKHPRFYIADPLCWAFILIGLGFALHYYPFKVVKYDQYHGEQGAGPYQEVIDYVNKHGGMTFWSAPESMTHMRVDPVIVANPPATEHMLKAKNYTGFCCFYEGYRSVGGPGGAWDTILNDYCAGRRERPVWTIGEMSYHGKEAGVSKTLDEVQTVLFVPSKSKENIFKAMKKGNMYAVRSSKTHRMELKSFTVENSKGQKANMGEELQADSPVTVRFELNWTGEPEEIISARLIRGGILIKEFFITEPGKFEYQDNLNNNGRRSYYRLDIRGKYPSMLFSNPVFVRSAREKQG
ncbi:MAG: hypothetical protein WBD17_05745 [Candidatus Omnitrophota bacterium]